MKPEQLAKSSSWNTIPKQLEELLRTKPDEVFTINEAAQIVGGAPTSVRDYARHLPENQRMIIRKSLGHPRVFGSVSAINKLKKLMK